MIMLLMFKKHSKKAIKTYGIPKQIYLDNGKSL